MDPEEEERIRRRQAGTQVTPETFYIWKQKFDEEQLQNEPMKEAASSSAAIGEDKVCLGIVSTATYLLYNHSFTADGKAIIPF